MARKRVKKKQAKTKGQTNPANTSDGTVPSAATKVFGIPELLEMILIQRAVADVKELPTRGPNIDIEASRLALMIVPGTGISLPATSPYVLQRVDRTFRDTIKGSKDLRQLMLLDRGSKLIIHGKLVTDAQCNYAAFVAIFGFEHSEYYIMPPHIDRMLPRALYSVLLMHFRHKDHHQKHFLDETETKGFQTIVMPKLRQPNASWNDIKLRISPEAEPLIIRQWVLHPGADPTVGYCCDLNVAGQTTLGAVTAEISKIHARTPEQHWDRSIGYSWYGIVDRSSDELDPQRLSNQNMAHYSEVIQVKGSN